MLSTPCRTALLEGRAPQGHDPGLRRPPGCVSGGAGVWEGPGPAARTAQMRLRSGPRVSPWWNRGSWAELTRLLETEEEHTNHLAPGGLREQEGRC